MTESNWTNATKPSALAAAIAHAEGFGVVGAIPTQAHNPGDLVLGDKGHGTLGAEAITVFQDDATGWAALDHQLEMIRTHRSHVYTVGMTIREMAAHWTRTQPDAWAQNVADDLTKNGRPSTVDTLLKEVL